MEATKLHKEIEQCLKDSDYMKMYVLRPDTFNDTYILASMLDDVSSLLNESVMSASANDDIKRRQIVRCFTILSILYDRLSPHFGEENKENKNNENDEAK